MSLILDTNVISAVRRPDRAPGLVAWLADQPDSELFLSVVTLGEIERGIAKAETRDQEFARDLNIWLERTITLFSDRILSFDAADARHWGRLSATLGHAGADLLIAAQALARDFTVVTGNVTDFEPTGVRIFNPF